MKKTIAPGVSIFLFSIVTMVAVTAIATAQERTTTETTPQTTTQPSTSGGTFLPLLPNDIPLNITPSPGASDILAAPVPAYDDLKPGDLVVTNCGTHIFNQWANPDCASGDSRTHICSQFGTWYGVDGICGKAFDRFYYSVRTYDKTFYDPKGYPVEVDPSRYCIKESTPKIVLGRCVWDDNPMALGYIDCETWLRKAGATWYEMCARVVGKRSAVCK